MTETDAWIQDRAETCQGSQYPENLLKKKTTKKENQEEFFQRSEKLFNKSQEVKIFRT